MKARKNQTKSQGAKVKEKTPLKVTHSSLSEEDCSKLLSLKSSLESQISQILRKIKQEAKEVIANIKKFTHAETLRLLNHSMSLVHQLQEAATLKYPSLDSDNPVIRGLYRSKGEILRELSYCIEQKGFFQFLSFDASEGPRVHMNIPHLEAVNRIVIELKRSPNIAVVDKKVEIPSVPAPKPYMYKAIEANSESRFSYFVDYDTKEIVKVDGETGAFAALANKPPSSFGVLGCLCRLPDNSVMHIGGSCYPKEAMSEFFKITEDFIEVNTMPPMQAVASLTAVYYAGSVFLFGGISKQAPSKLCARYNLNMCCWDTVKELPQASGFNTACLVGDTILVTGYHMDRIFAYIPQDDQFVTICNVSNREYKILFTAFSKVYLICAEKVFVAQLHDLSAFQEIASAPKILAGLSSPPTRLGQTVHFVIGKNELWKYNMRNNQVTRTYYKEGQRIN